MVATPAAPKPPVPGPPDPSPSGPRSGDLLQWFREIVAAVLSVVILVSAIRMLYGTYATARDSAGGSTPTEAQKSAYEHQKDIMLYGLALLGTVTGYYLGRVPAEMHAREAQQSATTAQTQLHRTQDRLADTAGTAAVAAERATLAHERLLRAADAVASAREVIRKAAGGAQRSTDQGPAIDAAVADALRQAEQRLDRALDQFQG